MMSCHAHRWLLLSVIVSAGGPALFPDIAVAQERNDERPTHLEMPSDAPVKRGAMPESPPRVIDFGPSGIVAGGTQVNLSLDGMNIVGDAANEPSIAVDPLAPNRIAVGWRQFDSIASNFRQAGYSFSRDGGRTWAGMRVIEPGVFRSDPVLRAGPDGTFYYLSLTVDDFGLVADMFLSENGGATWPTKAFAFGGDKQWFAIDSTGGIGHGHLYQAWNTAGNIYFPAQFNRSVNGGTVWEEPVVYTPGVPSPARPVFGILDVGPDGAVYVAGSANSANTGTFWLVRSDSARDALIKPLFELVTPLDFGGNLIIGRGPNPAGLLGQVNVAVDRSGGPTDGNVYVLCSVDPPGDDPMDVMFLRSADRGATFSTPIRVNDDPAIADAWQWFGTMSVAPNGRIDVVWNDTRNSLRPNIAELFYASSVDGGQTWSVNAPLSPSFDSHLGWPGQNKLGDYYDMTSDETGAHLAWAATFNGEQDVYYLRIGDYDCNGNAIPDGEEIAADPDLDCNLNGIPDACDLDAGVSIDADGDGVPDDCGDCNGNGIADFLDVAEDRSDDCNGNSVPDECETEGDCDGNGVPDECEAASGEIEDCNENGIPDICDVDCNHNGQPDDCDLVQFFARSGPLSPVGDGLIQSFVMSGVPVADGEVEFVFAARGDLLGPHKKIRVEINTVSLFDVFDGSGEICPEQPDRQFITMNRAYFNVLAQFDPDRNVTIDLIPDPSIDAAACDGESFIEVVVRYPADTMIDQNGNGVPDECDPPTCHDQEATVWVDLDGIVRGGVFDGRPYFGILLGTPDDDVIVGTDGPDLIIGLGGADVICGGGGDDLINANNGDDLLDGGGGFDVLHGGGGEDQCIDGERNGNCESGDIPVVDARAQRLQRNPSR